MSPTANTSTSGHTVASGGATIDAAEDMTGGDGFETALLRTKINAAQERGQEELANNLKREYAKQRYPEFGANTQLRKDEAEEIDDQLKTVARRNLVLLQDLIDAGLTIPLDLGTLRWEWEDIDDMGDALVDMTGTTGGGEDVPDYDENGQPLPLVHKSVYFDRRKLEASRKRGEPIDTTAVSQSTRAVRERLENGIANGYPGITVQGDTIYGYTTHPDRATVSANAAYDSASSDDMIDDQMRLIEALEDQNLGGSDIMVYMGRQPYQDIRAKNAGTDDKRGVLDLVRERLESEDGFPGVSFRRADYLDDNEAVAVEMNEMTVELANVSDFQVVEWEDSGGWQLHYKVLASMIPVLKSDRNGNMGLAHLTGL